MPEALYLTKHFALSDIKAEGEGADLTAWATTYGNTDRDGDVLAPGAFADATLPVPLLRSHGRNDPVGRLTLLRSEDRGLYVEAVFSDATAGIQARVLTRDGGFPYLSVGMRYFAADTELLDDGRTVIHKAELLEVSIVTVPANPQAVVLTAKSLDGGVQVEATGDGLDADKLAGLIAAELERRTDARIADATKAADDAGEPDPMVALSEAAKAFGEPFASAVTAHAEALISGAKKSLEGVAPIEAAPTVPVIDAQEALREMEALLAQV